jgi:4'-phosphopantetheinyl transferase
MRPIPDDDHTEPICHGTMMLHVWSLDLADTQEGLWPACAEVLDDTEQRKAAAFRHNADRLSYIAAHALLRLALTTLYPRPAYAWRLTQDGHGKPRLAEGEGLPGLRFSLSHTRGMVLVCIGRAMELGADVEAVIGDDMGPALADRYFAAAEAEMLRAQPNAAAVRERFTLLWILKEAFLKAHGTGLSQALDTVVFETVDPPRMTFSDPALGDPKRWRFWLSSQGCFRLAVAFATSDGRAVSITHHQPRLSASGTLSL